MNPWRALLDVQAVDTALVQLEHRAANLPERATLEALEAELADLASRSGRTTAARHELERAQQRLEDEIARLRDKVDQANAQLYGGAVTDPKQLRALGDEVASLEHQISRLEDQVLELMEQIEPLDRELASLAETRADLDRRAEAALAALAEAEVEIDAERRRLHERRAETTEGVAEDTLAAYEATRARLGGVAVARLEGGVCGACHIKLSAVEHDQIQHLDPDEPVRCEDCGRYLVRD